MENDNLEQTEVSTNEGSQEGATAESQAAEQAQQIAELEAMDRFKFNGKEMTAKELNSMVMARSDYTQKTQALAEDRKYINALKDDMPALKANPGLADKFREVYPPQYHWVLDALGIAPKAESKQSSGQALPPEMQEFVQRLDRIEGQTREKQVQAISAELDNIYGTLGKKYPYAREKEVTAAASALLDHLTKEQGDDAQLTPAHFDRLFKQSHDEISKMFDSRQSERMKTQKQANARGRDVGPGGGTPGAAPQRPRTLKEATALAMQEISNLN